MRANEVLLWLSARREGSWRQFREAVEELHSTDDNSDSTDTLDGGFPIHLQLRLDLERLAHVEFFARDCRSGWRVAPPTLAAHPVPGGVRAILCGGRSQELWARVLRTGEKLHCETPGSPGVPEVIRMVASSELALTEAASQAGVHFQPDAPLAILSHLPPCDVPSRRRPQAQFPHGENWRIRKFDALTLAWQAVERKQAESEHTGLFEFQLFDRWHYFLRSAKRTVEMPRGVAVYAHLHYHTGVLRYDAQAGTLGVPGTCRPPRLLERALVLCSGLPPSYDSRTARLTYADVRPEIARYAAALLRQRLT